MNTIANQNPTRLILTVLALSLPALSLFSQPLSPIDKPVVVETEDGLILNGTIASADENNAVLNTPYGTLTVPLPKILRIDGDTFDAKQGIIREHTAVLRRDGSVILEYIQPVSAAYTNRTVNLLTLGNVLKICDLNGEPLDFMARKVDDFTRCSVTMPEYRLPAVRIQVLQLAATLCQENRITYTYHYTPRIEQTFRLRLEIPIGATVLDANPKPADQSSIEILWEEILRRQQTADFSITVELK